VKHTDFEKALVGKKIKHVHRKGKGGAMNCSVWGWRFPEKSIFLKMHLRSQKLNFRLSNFQNAFSGI